jgi:multiple sugar transport system ATP-binding protein
MDEPLSNLDAKLRIQTRAEIVALQARLGTTTLYVTHDQVEAMTMGHRIAVMNDGILQQVATPSALYENPQNVFVARFVGNPGMNIVTGVVDSEARSIHLGGVDASPGFLHDDAYQFNGPLSLGFRPESVALSSTGLPGSVSLIERLGSEVHVVVTIETGEILTVRQAANEVIPSLGDSVHLAVTGKVLAFDAQTGERR